MVNEVEIAEMLRKALATLLLYPAKEVDKEERKAALARLRADVKKLSNEDVDAMASACGLLAEIDRSHIILLFARQAQKQFVESRPFTDGLPSALRLVGMWPEEPDAQLTEAQMLEEITGSVGALSGVYLRAMLRVCSALVILQERKAALNKA